MKLPKQTVGTSHGELTASNSRQLRISLPGGLAKEIGLGDAVKNITSRVGFKPCGGCQKRAAVLNQRIVFVPSRKK